MGVNNVDYHSVAEKEILDSKPTPAVPKGFGARHLQTLILFVSLTVAYSMRAQLSVTMVAMTSPVVDITDLCNNTDKIFSVNNETLVDSNNRSVNNETNANETGNCTEKPEAVLSKWSPYRSYKWNKATQEMILFSFFVGYTTMMFPMGMIAQKYGWKKPVLIALAVNGIISILTPWVPIFTGWIGVCLCRLLQGLTQAAMYPSIHTMLGKWAPVTERGRLSTYIYSGSQLGTILIFQLAGLLSGIPALGWPSIFWLCGGLALCCFAMLFCFGEANPQDCDNMSSEELIYIMGDGSADTSAKKRRTPWTQILKSKAVWGMTVSHAGSAMGYLLILTQIPTYMSKVLNVDIKRNGLYSSLPYIALYVMILFFGWFSDMLIVKKIMSTLNVRRAASCIGTIISAMFFVAFGYVNSTGLAVIMLIISLALHSGTHVGFHINGIDLAPNYAGPLMGMSNMVANLSSLLVPVMVSNIIQDDVTNHRRWQTLFIIIAVIQTVTTVIYIIVAKGEVQEWNFYGDDENDAAEYPLQENNANVFKKKSSMEGKNNDA